MLEILIEGHQFYDIYNIKTLKRKLVLEGIIRFGLVNSNYAFLSLELLLVRGEILKCLFQFN